MDTVLYSKEQVTVATYEKYPQLLRFDKISGIIPDIRKTTSADEKRDSFFDAIAEFFELMAKWFRKIFKIYPFFLYKHCCAAVFSSFPVHPCFYITISSLMEIFGLF